MNDSSTPAPTVATPRLRWWPDHRPDSIEIGAGGLGPLLSMGAAIAVIVGVLSLPISRAATGLSTLDAALILGGYYACMVVNDLVLHPLARRSRWGWHLQIASLFAYNHLFPMLLVVVPNRPWSPLWMALALWAFQSGSWRDIEGSWFALACHALLPLTTIPVFLARGAPLAESIAAPMITSLVCGMGYLFLSSLTAQWRAMRSAQQAELDGVRARNATLERERVARDLHDSLGSILSLTQSYAGVLRRQSDDPQAIRKLATTLEEMGREGVSELRNLLDALVPEDDSFAGLAETARRLAARSEVADEIEVRLECSGDGTRLLPGVVHLSVARVLQEALRNAVRHGRAGRVTVSITLAGRLALTVVDDGRGLGDPREGARGLAGMRRRAEELGGTCTIESTPGAGVRIVWEIPIAPDQVRDLAASG